MTDEKDSADKNFYISPISANLFKAVGIDEEDES